ncbi:hypothetical protein BpHYR1_035066 [Brachionus plicatilis]|uniref:RING-type domain-containing protein n=1 Tax=Brachionus plicatilis TaxID=10195 RepID=A0A3M7SZ96_BRAPC|nr:hypothetical protein BpHYR1_035066 [Brachionus plicatilis]
MISKFQINKDILICCKCKQFNHNLLALPCHHFVCTDCISSQKIKVVYHCKKWKIFFNHELNSPICYSKSNRLYQKFIRFKEDCWLSSLEISFYSFLNSNEENFHLIENKFECTICTNVSGKLCTDYFGNPICEKCSQSSNLNQKSNLKIKQTVSDIFDYFTKKLNYRIEKLFSNLDVFFNQIDPKIDLANSWISNEKFISAFNLDDKKVISETTKAINISRKQLIQEVELKKFNSLKCLAYEFKEKFNFKEFQTSLNSIQVIGFLKNDVPIVNRVKFIQFYPKLFTFKTLIHSEKNYINWTPLNKIIDYFSPIYLSRFYCIYLNDFNHELSYETVIRNPITNLNFNLYKFINEEKLEYFRIDHKLNRIGFLFEIKYNKKYAIKIYDLYGSRLICSRYFDFYIDNFLFDDKLIVAWNSSSSYCLSVYDENLQYLEGIIEMDEDLYDIFYYLADCDEEFLYLNNQNQIGKVSKTNGRLEQIFNWFDREIFSGSEIEGPLHVSSEYLNVKIYQEFMIVTTYSKIYVFEKKNFKLLCENKIFLIKNNDWSIPNKIYFTKDGYLAFFDKNNITFI